MKPHVKTPAVDTSGLGRQVHTPPRRAVRGESSRESRQITVNNLDACELTAALIYGAQNLRCAALELSAVRRFLLRDPFVALHVHVRFFTLPRVKRPKLSVDAASRERPCASTASPVDATRAARIDERDGRCGVRQARASQGRAPLPY